ncbi:MAG: AAA family ATPase [Mycoplasmataceae bacterium]|nr:AAA family ATPase [Mycoplasmataceae bacterium]
MKKFNRHLTKLVRQTMSEYKCTLIYGPRQVGKTTLIDTIRENKYKKVTFDDKNTRDYAQRDTSGFLKFYKTPLFIDEVQKLPGIFEHIKVVIDKSEDTGQYIFTGSEILQLLKSSDDSLSTRICLLNMQSLSQSEILGKPNWIFKPNFDELINRQSPCEQIEVFNSIVRGSMPDLNNGKISNPTSFYQTYIKNTVVKDIRDEFTSIADETNFWHFIEVLATYVGEQISYEKLAKLTNLNFRTLKKWINALEAIGIIFFLHPYSNNILKRIVKSPKLYFYDTGLVCCLLKFTDGATLLSSDMGGHLFECYAISEICKSYINAGLIPQVYYVQDIFNKKKQIDLIIEGENNTIYPVEVKSNVSIHSNYFDNIKILQGIEKKKVGPMSVVCCSEELSTKGKDKIVIPITYI